MFSLPPSPFYEAGLVKRVMASPFYPGFHASPQGVTRPK
jgi:hypothetical protein